MRYAALVPRGEPVPASLEFAGAWYADVSGGAVHPRPEVVRVSAPAGGWSRWAARRWPSDADLVRDAATELVEGLPPGSRSRIGSVVLIVAPATDAHPHTWRFRGGGVHLGGRRWCRSYSVVPERAPLPVVVHELGHLLFGWPDLGRTSGAASDCLMATGALVPAGRPPAWPCAPLRVAAGWVAPVPLAADTSVGDLGPGIVGSHGSELVERRGEHVLAYACDPPRVVRRVTVRDATRPVLAVLADGR